MSVAYRSAEADPVASAAVVAEAARAAAAEALKQDASAAATDTELAAEAARATAAEGAGSSALATHAGLTTTAHGGIVASTDARLSDQRTPTDGSVTAAKVNTALKPSGSAAAGDEALRALGTGGTQATAGNDSRLPTAGQKNALAGTSGTPGTGNEYLTKQDATVATAASVTAEASRATAAEALAIPLTQKGAASGVASLDSDGKVPSAQVRGGQLAYVERISGWNAFTSDQSWAYIEGLADEFTLSEASDVRISAAGISAQIVTAGNKLRIAVYVDGARKLNGQAGAGGFNTSQTQQWVAFPRLERTLRLASGVHYIQVGAMHQTQGTGNTSSADALWADMTSFVGGVNEEGAMTLEAWLA